MAYMDVGNIYSQLYRKPKYTQIGATRVYEPMRINLDQMYGQRYEQTQMPTAPIAPTYTPPISTGAGLPTVGQGVDEQYLATHGWVKITPEGDIESTKLWMPAVANEGDLYETAGGRYYFHNGKWYKMKIGEEGEYEQPEGLEDIYTQIEQKNSEISDLQTKNKTLEQTLRQAQYVYSHGNPSQEILNTINTLIAQIEVNNNRITQIQTEITDLESSLPEPISGEQPYLSGNIVASWQDQYNQLMQQLDTGELQYLDENGNLNLTQLRGMQNMWGDWLADVIEKSYQTGAIAGDIINYNPETGEYDLAPELQTMEEYIGLQNEEVIKEWQQFNRQLALNAIASGHSLNSGFYSEVLASNLADYTMNVTNEIAGTMMGEIQAQYQYITNSIKEAMLDMKYNIDTEAFMADVQTQWEATQEQYRQQTELLAQQVAETEAARRGQFLTAAITFIVQLSLLLIFKAPVPL